MPKPASPREVLDRLIDGVTGKEWDELPDLYAEDTVVEHPFAIPPQPKRLEGREALRRHFAAGPRQPLDLRARNIVVHDTADPEVIVGEFDYDVHVTTTGRSFTVANILVVQVRDGQIVYSRDYHDHYALAGALDRLPAPQP
jgi:ketosteroid isomerase-like protein